MRNNTVQYRNDDIFSESETLARKQPRLFLWLNMSGAFVEKYDYDERGTFKIYCCFVLGQANFQWSAGALVR